MSRCRFFIFGTGAGFGATAAAALLLCVGFGGFMGTASALTVIHDSGDTTPITPYLAPLQESPDTGASDRKEPEPIAPLPFDVHHLLPIRTPELAPGSLSGRSLPPEVIERLPLLAVPVFVIGADRLSLAWLTRNRESLKAMGAMGLLVQAETEADLRAVARAGAGLNIAPVPGAELARVLGLSRYPVLLTPRGLMQ